MNGATGVRRVRSASGIGISVVWVEFDWGTDIYVDRQIVAEKLQLVGAQPAARRGAAGARADLVDHGRDPVHRPDAATAHAADRAARGADWTVRRRLLAVPGVAQVIPIGGGVKQFQVLVDPARPPRLRR